MAIAFKRQTPSNNLVEKHGVLFLVLITLTAAVCAAIRLTSRRRGE